MTAVTAVLLVSLFGSLHCAGMCGPLVAFAVGGTGPEMSRWRRALLHGLYHGGRMISYALLGAIAGVLGAALNLGGAWVGVQRIAAIVAGAMMVAVGIAALLHHRGIGLPRIGIPGWIRRIAALGQRAAVGLRPLPRSFVMGLLTALLPCGWLYAFVIVAAGAGSMFWGAAVMVAFWAGTVPVLASVGLGAQALAGALGRKLPLATALLLVAVGLMTIGGRLMVPAHAIDSHLQQLRGLNADQQLQQIEDTTPPCCQHDDPH
jgi:hypothetical protein